MRKLYIFIFFFYSLAAWSQEYDKQLEKQLQTAFIMVEDGGIVEVPEGRILLLRTLWMDEKKNVRIRGKGIERTILDFSGQKDGAEGIKITGSLNITIEDLTVVDASGDAIKAQNTDGMVFRNVKATWSGKPGKKNGAYGLYPVLCQNILIEDCEVSGASDAGIYVGQSRNIVVRNNRAHHNVAGIEIENSLYADVYDNESYENTGGILVFDLPDLEQKQGGFVRVFNNRVYNNNYKNFAPAGNIVGKVPPGTGLMILATNNVEVFGNRIERNQSVSLGIISYYMTELPINDKDYYPYPTRIYIHDNNFSRDRTRPTMQGRFGKMLRFKLKFGKDVPHIMYDGIVDKKQSSGKNEELTPAEICIINNSDQSFADLDAENNFENVRWNIGRHDCNLEAIEPVTLDLR